MNLDELLKDVEERVNRREEESGLHASDNSFVGWVTKDMAQRLLPKSQYRDDCSYKIICRDDVRYLQTISEETNEVVSEFAISDENDTKVLYDEFIPTELAKELVPEGSFNPACFYKLITTLYETVVAQVDPNTMKPVQEFELKSEDEVETYDDMCKNIIMGKPDRPPKVEYDLYETPKSRWWVLPLVLFALLLVGGVVLIMFTLNLRV